MMGLESRGDPYSGRSSGAGALRRVMLGPAQLLALVYWLRAIPNYVTVSLAYT